MQYTCRQTHDIRPSVREVYSSIYDIIQKNKIFTIYRSSNKGEVGILLEKLCGIPQSSALLDCLDGELKLFPLKYNENKQRFVPKESISVTMHHSEVDQHVPFEESKVFSKLEKVLFVGYFDANCKGSKERKIQFLNAFMFDIHEHPKIYEELRSDYEKIKEYYKCHGRITGKVGTLLQSRTKGIGGFKKDGTMRKKTRAFYLKPLFVFDVILK